MCPVLIFIISARCLTMLVEALHISDHFGPREDDAGEQCSVVPYHLFSTVRLDEHDYSQALSMHFDLSPHALSHLYGAVSSV
jgi:hypothetical protein